MFKPLSPNAPPSAIAQGSQHVGTRVVDAAVADGDAPCLDQLRDVAACRIAKAARVHGRPAALPASNSARTMACPDVERDTNIVGSYVTVTQMASPDVYKNTSIVGGYVTVTQLAQEGDHAIDIP